MAKRPLREAAASRLRSLADGLTRRGQTPSDRPLAPLVRLGGRWWHRDEIEAPAAAVEAPAEGDASS